MRLSFRFVLPALTAALTACAESPSAPAPSAVARGDAPLASAATVAGGTSVFTFSGDFTSDTPPDGVVSECFGEDIHVELHAPLAWRLVETPTGDFVYHDHFLTKQVVGSAVGLSTGTVWTRRQNVSPFLQHSMGGGLVFNTGRTTFVSETGPTVVVTEVFHVGTSANGAREVQFFKVNCHAK
jgi:hypothetical protein